MNKQILPAEKGLCFVQSGEWSSRDFSVPYTKLDVVLNHCGSLRAVLSLPFLCAILFAPKIVLFFLPLPRTFLATCLHDVPNS